MFASIRIQGLGPLDDMTIQLDPTGITEGRGPSESGKSTVLEAVCFCLFGCDSHGNAMQPEAVRDGHRKIDVEITTAMGTILRRTMTRSRNFSRRKGSASYSSESEFRAAHKLAAEIKADGRRELIARLIMSPMSWVPLSTQNARGLRDVLCGGGNMTPDVARLFGAEPQTVDLKKAMGLLLDARRDADQADGAFTQARLNVSNLGEPPTAPDAADAERVLEQGRAWDAYQVWTEWKGRRDAIGEKPDGDSGNATAEDDHTLTAHKYGIAAIKLEEARRDLAINEREGINTYVEAEAAALTARDVASEALARATTAAESDVCPTCDRDGWTDPQKHLDKMTTAWQDADTAAKEATTKADATRAERQAEFDTAIIAARAQIAADEETLGALEAAVTKAEKAREAARASAAALVAWGNAAAAVGDEPPMGKQIQDPGPTDAALQAARATVHSATLHEGAAAEHLRQVEIADEEVHRAELLAVGDREKVDDLERLVQAIRDAPSAMLRRNLERFGDLGPVSLRVPDDGPAVEILIDGRDWRLASTGKLVVADLWFRMGLRRAFGMTWFPMFVDNAAAWSGDWPKADGPMIRLVTTKDAGMAWRSA